jgi:enoyl-CoA hydratase/carnithine racemase
MIGVEDTGTVRVLTIDRPPVNALDVATLSSLAGHVRDCTGLAVTALILTGAGPVFSAGLDLHDFIGAPSAPAEQAALARIADFIGRHIADGHTQPGALFTP